MLYQRHGDSKSVEYAAWSEMKTRARRKAHYENRQVCTEWIHDYPAFLAHVGRKPTPKHTLDRIKNDKGYEPGNVQWATITKQTRNTSKNVWITHDGLTLVAADWATRLGLPIETICWRARQGLTPEQVLSTDRLQHRIHTPPKRNVRGLAITHNGETRFLSDWAQVRGINRATLYDRIQRSANMPSPICLRRNRQL